MHLEFVAYRIINFFKKMSSFQFYKEQMVSEVTNNSGKLEGKHWSCLFLEEG